MNPLFKTLQIPTEATENSMPIHQISVMEIAGHKLCKLCAKKLYINRRSLMKLNYNSAYYNKKSKIQVEINAILTVVLKIM